MSYIRLVALLLACFSFSTLHATTITVAVASNFAPTLKALAVQFTAQTKIEITPIAASTGKLYAQIKNGLPADVLLSADSETPQKLELEKLAIVGSRRTYARGKLILWSAQPNMVDRFGNVLKQEIFDHIAIANPKLAPYGQAAQQVLEARGVWDKLQSHIVQGENIAQTFQFVQTGQATLGFIAYAQIKNPEAPINSGSWWDIPASLYAPIDQQVVLLKDNDATRTFLKFLSSRQAKTTIRLYGYTVP